MDRKPQVISYSGREPPSHHVEMAYRRSVTQFYLNDSVLLFSQTGYQTENMSL